MHLTRRQREWGLVCLLIVGAVLFRIILAVTANAANAANQQTSVNTTGLPLQSGRVTVSISNKLYHPATLLVTAGTTVTWVNHDPMAHTVTQGAHASATPHGFASGVLASGQSWSYTFRTPGTYTYTCLFHPDMNGAVVVKQQT